MLIPVFCAEYVCAQRLPKEFVELNANIGFGSKITQSNVYYGGNFSLYNHSRFYFTTGVRLSATHNLRTMSFAMPQPIAPVITYNDEGVWISSLNFAFGVSCAITENFFMSLNAEVLGLSLMSDLNGTITSNGNTSLFSSQPTATNILLNPSNIGNLQNQLMFNFRLNDQWFLNAVVANQRSQVDFTSSLTDYGSFSLTDNAYFFLGGIQWRYVRTKKAP